MERLKDLYSLPTFGEFMRLVEEMSSVLDLNDPITPDHAQEIIELLTGLDYGSELLRRIKTFGSWKAYQSPDNIGIPGVIDINKATQPELMEFIVECARLSKYIKAETGVISEVLESNVGQAQNKLGQKMRENDQTQIKFEFDGYNLTFTREVRLRPTFMDKPEVFTFLPNIGQGDCIQPTVPWQTLEKIMENCLGDLPMAPYENGVPNVSDIPEVTERDEVNDQGEFEKKQIPSYFVYHDGSKYIVAERLPAGVSENGQEYRNVATLYETNSAKLTSRKY